MNKRKNHTDELFRSRLHQFDASPPPKAWQGIVSSLDSSRRKQRLVVFWRMAASVAALIAVGATFFLVRQSPEASITQQNQAVQVVEQEMHDAGPGMRPETPAQGPIPVLAKQESKPSEEVLIIMEEAAYSANPGIASMTPVHGYNAVLFGYEGPEDRMLIAHIQPLTPALDEDEGIDVFDEWGENTIDQYNKWAVGTQVTPLYSYRTLTGAGDAAAYATYFNQVENGLLAYAGGINVNYSPRKRLAVQSGLYYSKMGMVVGNVQYVTTDAAYGASSWNKNLLAVQNSSGNIQSGSVPGGGFFYAMSDRAQNETTAIVDNLADFSNLPASGGEVIQHFEYLELPVILRYKVIDRKLGFNVLGGMSTNFLVGRDAYFQQEGEKEIIGFTGDLKTVNYSSVVGVGLAYAISSRLNVSVEPTFRYYLNSINELSSLSSHPYSLGFYTGLSYSF